mmetsp:Transcript_25981/g.78277  ORF Transcript_25981/g.78277 Transcript_25981/m.78277 type:complete len:234 (+) Transcript_25981:1799-2500(+)
MEMLRAPPMPTFSAAATRGPRSGSRSFNDANRAKIVSSESPPASSCSMRYRPCALTFGTSTCILSGASTPLSTGARPMSRSLTQLCTPCAPASEFSASAAMLNSCMTCVSMPMRTRRKSSSIWSLKKRLSRHPLMPLKCSLNMVSSSGNVILKMRVSPSTARLTTCPTDPTPNISIVPMSTFCIVSAGKIASKCFCTRSVPTGVFVSMTGNNAAFTFSSGTSSVLRKRWASLT